MILVTGFEPFGAQSKNASWEAVKRLPDTIAGHTVKKLRLPVVFGAASDAIKAFAELERPAFVFPVGEAGGRRFITPETTAVNRRCAVPDNADYCPQQGAPCVPGGAESLRTPVPVGKIAKRLQAAGYAVEPSDNAGTFVCNDTFYRTLHSLADRGTVIDFIHVPYCDAEQTAAAARNHSGEEIASASIPTIDSETVAKTLAAYIESVVKWAENTCRFVNDM